MRLRRLAIACSGPIAFALAAKLGARRERGYVPRDEPISALAAQGMQSAVVMVPGFLGLAAGSVACARVIRGARTAPAPIPAMLVATGAAVAGAGLARCSDRSCPTRALGDANVTLVDDVHAGVSTIAFGLWIAMPLVAAARARQAPPAYRALSAALGASTLAALVGGGLLAKRSTGGGSGAAQRATLIVGLSWYALAAAAA